MSGPWIVGDSANTAVAAAIEAHRMTGGDESSQALADVAVRAVVEWLEEESRTLTGRLAPSLSDSADHLAAMAGWRE